MAKTPGRAALPAHDHTKRVVSAQPRRGALPKAVANGVNADDCARCVFDRLIAGHAFYAENWCLAVVWFTCADRVESRAAQFASKRLRQSRCYADVFVALALHEQRRRHPFAALLRDLI